MKTGIGRGGLIWWAGGAAALAYGWLAHTAQTPEVRGWLGLAHVVGWLSLAVVAWRGREHRGTWWAVAGLGIVFRLIGVGTAPGWEDDYHRYLWDGYVTLTTGDPYALAPLEALPPEAAVPAAVAEALDGINHPDLPTIYGPVSQAVFALAAATVPGSLAVLKLWLLAAECIGWWLLRPQLSWRGWLLVWWCPLAVTEIAFAGHPEALGVALTAVAVASWQRAQGAGTALAVAWATAVKPFGAALAPFIGWRFGGRAAAVGLAGWMLCYLPFWLQGSAGEWPAVRVMSQSFEYNSTGFAVLALVLPDGWARGVAGGLTLIGATLLWWRWSRGPLDKLPPVAAMLGVALLLSPVVNPWYALWLLPWLAVQPRAWGIGVLIAVPLAYTHGWGQALGAGVDYTHPWWTRPLEVAVVLAAVGLGRAPWLVRLFRREDGRSEV